MRYRLAGRTIRPRRDFLTGVSSLGLLALTLGTAHAQAMLPSGGSVASGSASIASGTNGVTVTQTSDRAIVNWTGFDVGAGKSVVFAQPNAQSATLNRVTGTAGSTIAGSITSNGAVYLVNPNGIAITATGSVQTGGGFVASTLDIADGDFTAGTLNFTGHGASAGVSNAGKIVAGSGGYVALLGGSVSNAGTIDVALGKVALASGEQVALDLSGDGFLRVAVPTAAVAPGNGALIAMTGRIAAAGGRVVLSAATARDAVRGVINMPGSIVADTAVGKGGSIVLLGGDGGTVTVGGTLSARATGASGDGGFVETSGAKVDFTGLKVDTSAAHGATGTWLVDPTDLTVDAAAAATISGNLATSNVTLQTTATTASGPGVQSAGNGDITVNSAVAWTSANTLSLLAYNNINLNAAITASNNAGRLTLTAGNNVAYAGTVSGAAPVAVGIFNLTNGNWSQTGTLPTFAARDFRFDVTKATFLRTAGSGTGASGSPYVISDVYGLQGMASKSTLANSFVLGGDIDASGTVNWNSGAGFVAIGTNGAGNVWSGTAFSGGTTGFTGTLNGAGFGINGLTINRASTQYQGLIGYATGSVVLNNLTLTNTAVSGAGYTGGIAGYVKGATASLTNDVIGGAVTSTSGSFYTGGMVGALAQGTVSGSHSSVVVTGGGHVGGLVGDMGLGAVVTNDYATGNVIAAGSSGGLVGLGYINSVISNSYATGNVTTSSGYSGGLIGIANGSIISNVYASGTVTATAANATDVGGLLGYGMYQARIDGAYATGAVTSPGSNVGGLVGDLYGFSTGTATTSITNSYASGAVSGGSAVGGIVGGIDNISSVTNSYWDSYSTGQASAYGAISGTGGTVGNLNAVTSNPNAAGGPTAYLAASYANLTSATGLGTATPSGFVFLPGDITRPFLAFEVPTSATVASNAAGSLLITNSHQLELIGYDSTRLAQNYAVANDINLAETGAVVVGTPASYAGMWAATGFNPIGRLGGQGGLVGNFDGQNHILSGLTIHDTSGTIYVGMFGFTAGANISNVGLTGVNVTGGNGGGIGGLVGQFNTGTLSNSYVTGTVSGGTVGSNVGGLVGNLTGMVVNSRSSATVSGTNNIGGLIGSQTSSGGVVTNSYATGNVSGTTVVGGLIGNSGASIRNAYATGTVTGTGNTVGGLVGSFGGTNNSIVSAYATGAVSGGGTFIGGLLGRVGSGTVGSVYATGSVNGGSSVGGLVGYQTGGTINGGYASGAVTGGGNVGGLIGQQTTGSQTNPASISNAYWDQYSTGQALAFGTGNGGATAINAVTSNPNAAGGATAYSAASYANLPGASGIGTATPTGFVFVAGDTTRPFLAGEVPVAGNGMTLTNAAGQVVIGNAHQFQLVDYNAQTLAAGYALGGAIDLSETGRVAAGNAASYAGMWAGTGWVPLGSDGAGNLWNGSTFVAVGYADVGRAGTATGFTGSLAGGGNAVSGLAISRGAAQNVGLFGGSSGTIANVSVGGAITGLISTGGLVGLQQGGGITGASSAVAVTGASGSSYVGGLVGFASGAAITGSSASGAVSATGAAGGLVGLLYQSTVNNSNASGAVTGRSGKTGGLIGIVESSTVTGGASSGAVNGVAGGPGYGVLRSGGTYNGQSETP